MRGVRVFLAGLALALALVCAGAAAPPPTVRLKVDLVPVTTTPEPSIGSTSVYPAACFTTPPMEIGCVRSDR